MPTARTRHKRETASPVDPHLIAEAVRSAVGTHLVTIARAQMVPVLPTEGFVRLRDLLRIFPVSEASWWAGVREGRYPKPVRLGAQLRAWKASDIRKLLAAAEDGELPAIWPEPAREATRSEATA
jgi:prophage regulatory protein